MGVRRGDDVGSRGVHGRVDHERRSIDRAFALDDLTFVVDEDQVRNPDVAKVHAEGIDPEVVEQFGVTDRDVPGDALGEAQLAEYAKGAGETLLAVTALGFDRRKGRRNVEDELCLVFSESIRYVRLALPPNRLSSELYPWSF